MTTLQAMRRIDAKQCESCRGRGNTPGVFHRLLCTDCRGAGYVQSFTGQPLDTLAASIITTAIAQEAETARLARLEALRRNPLPDTGTPDNWILRDNFIGD